MADITTRAVTGGSSTHAVQQPTGPAIAGTPAGVGSGERIPLADPRARRLVDGQRQVATAGGPAHPSDVKISAPARDAADRQQYIVTVDPARIAADRQQSVRASVAALVTTQTAQQKALSNAARGRYVLFLDPAQRQKLQDAGAGVFPDYRIELERGAAPSAVARPLLSRTLHGADAVEGAGFDGAGVAVVVVDTGTSDHPDLPPRIAQDDVFTPEPDDPVTDDVGHSTHVSGISVARGDPAEGHMRGMAPAADLMSAKVLRNGAGTWSSVLAGVDDMIRWAQSYDGPVVGNLSLGGPSSGNPDEDPLCQLLDEAVTKYGIFVAVAAGNEGPDPGTIGSPGDARHVTTVAAVDHGGTLDAADDQVAWFSSRGKPGQGKPDVAADGVDVFSTVPGGGYAAWSGTSMATPNVAGAAAALLGKLWAMHRAGDLAVDPRELVKSGELQAVLLETARPVAGAGPEDEGAGDLRLDRAAGILVERHGRVEVNRAVQELIDVVQSAFDDDGAVSADEVAEAIRQVLEPESAGTLPRPDERIDYIESVQTYLDRLQAGRGPKLDDAAAAELRGVMTRFALSALSERARQPLEGAAQAFGLLEKAVMWAKTGDGVTRGDVTFLSDVLSGASDQLSPADGIDFLGKAATLIAGDQALGALAGQRSRLYEAAHGVLAARARQPFAGVADATAFFRTALAWTTCDVDRSGARTSRAVSDLAAVAAHGLGPVDRVAFLRSAAADAREALKGSRDASAVAADIQENLAAAMTARVRWAAAPFATGAEAAEVVDAFVEGQLTDRAYDAADASALSVLLHDLVRGGAADALLAEAGERKAFLGGTGRVLGGLLSRKRITAEQRTSLWRQLNDTVNERVRAIHRPATPATTAA